MEEENIRQVIYSEEFNDFYDSLDSRIQDKFDYGLRLIKTQYVDHSAQTVPLVSLK